MASSTEIKGMIMAAVERCLAMQADHLAGLKTGSLAKIGQWLEERQAMIAGLRQVLSEAQAAAAVDADLRGLLLNQLSCILDREKVLFAIAEEQRNGLQEQLATIRRGKRTLTGYGPGLDKSPPRFVSDKH